MFAAVLKCSYLVGLCRAILYQVLSAGNGSGIITMMSVNRGLHCSLRENEPTFDSAHIVAKCSSVASVQNQVQDSLAALHVHSQSWRTQSTFDLEMN